MGSPDRTYRKRQCVRCRYEALQAPDPFWSRARQPCHKRAQRIRPQDGLARPLCVGRRLCFTHRTCLANPMRASSGPFGAYGQPTNHIGRLRCTAASSAPRSIDSSPMPGCLTISSETDPSAQPPPGSSASSSRIPLETTRPTGRAS